jgi:hypothetical protein
VATRIQIRGNVPAKPLRWSIDRASAEFKLAQNTLKKYLNQSGAEPDEGGCYSTAQVTNAIFGDLRAERLRKERELTKRYALQNAITEGSVLDRAELSRTFALIADAMVSRINSATELPRNVREDLLRDLSTWPDAIKETVARQTKFPRGRDGQTGDDNQGED